MQRDPLEYYDSMNLYQYALNNPINYKDPFGEDVWIENGTKDEVIGHQRINVGDPNGNYISYSFAYNPSSSILDPQGYVYLDPYRGGKIVKEFYLETTSQEDEVVLKFLGSLVGTDATYLLLGSNCRDFSKSAFEVIEKAGIGKKSK